MKVNALGHTGDHGCHQWLNQRYSNKCAGFLPGRITLYYDQRHVPPAHCVQVIDPNFQRIHGA